MLTTPLVLPVTIPVSFTLATKGFPLVHVPPNVASANWTVEPAHTKDGPVIASTVNAVVTVNGKVAVLVQVPLLTV